MGDLFSFFVKYICFVVPGVVTLPCIQNAEAPEARWSQVWSQHVWVFLSSGVFGHRPMRTRMKGTEATSRVRMVMSMMERTSWASASERQLILFFQRQDIQAFLGLQGYRLIGHNSTPNYMGGEKEWVLWAESYSFCRGLCVGSSSKYGQASELGDTLYIRPDREEEAPLSKGVLHFVLSLESCLDMMDYMTSNSRVLQQAYAT